MSWNIRFQVIKEIFKIQECVRPFWLYKIFSISFLLLLSWPLFYPSLQCPLKFLLAETSQPAGLMWLSPNNNNNNYRRTHKSEEMPRTLSVEVTFKLRRKGWRHSGHVYVWEAGVSLEGVLNEKGKVVKNNLAFFFFFENWENVNVTRGKRVTRGSQNIKCLRGCNKGSGLYCWHNGQPTGWIQTGGDRFLFMF